MSEMRPHEVATLKYLALCRVALVAWVVTAVANVVVTSCRTADLQATRREAAELRRELDQLRAHCVEAPRP